MLYNKLSKRLITINLNKKRDVSVIPKTADEWLKFYGYTNINQTSLVFVPKGYDYGEQDFYYYTFPLYTAILEYNPDVELIEDMLKKGANPNFITPPAYDKQFGTGPVLHSLLKWSQSWNKDTIQIIQLLLDYKVDVNQIQLSDGRTPHEEAVFGWDSPYGEKIIKLLINHGAKINVLDDNHKTPYDNMIHSFGWYHNKNKPKPEKLIYLLDPHRE